MHRSHQLYMHRCLQLARQGEGLVAPNPMVGAVLVYQDKIIGEGFHQQFGGPHAEVNCLQSVPDNLRQYISKSTLYVSLEPCSFVGKTPACTELILEHQIPELIIATADPHVKVAGRGIERLVKAGVKIQQGVLQNEAALLNKHFFCFHQKYRPYFHLKWAQTRDEKIASADYTPLAISHAVTNIEMHKLRATYMAILVGVNTVLKDDPALTTRHWPGKSPIRIIIDKQLQIPDDARVLQSDTYTIIFNYRKEGLEKTRKYIRLEKDLPLYEQVAEKLFQLQINSVLVEGGAATLQGFLDAGLWDEATLITNSEMILGEGVHAPKLKNAKLQHSKISYGDRISTYVQID